MSIINLDFLCALTRILQQGLGNEQTFIAIFNLLDETVVFDSATLYGFNQEADQLEIVHHKGDFIVELAREITFERGQGFSSWASRQKEPIIIESLAKARPGREGRFKSFVSLPLWSGDVLLGVLNLGHHKSEVYRRIEISDFKILADQISLVFEKIILRQKVHEQNAQLKKAYQDLEEAQTKLIEKERLAAIGEITVTVNHEINNPLSAIVGLTEILELSLPIAPQDKIKNGIKSIYNEAMRIKKVTQRLTRIESSEITDYTDGLKMTKLPE